MKLTGMSKIRCAKDGQNIDLKIQNETTVTSKNQIPDLRDSQISESLNLEGLIPKSRPTPKKEIPNYLLKKCFLSPSHQKRENVTTTLKERHHLSTNYLCLPPPHTHTYKNNPSTLSQKK